MSRTEAVEVLVNLDMSERSLDFVADRLSSLQYGSTSGKINSSPVRILIPPMLRRGRVGFLRIKHAVAEEKLALMTLSYMYTTASYKSQRTSESTGES